MLRSIILLLLFFFIFSCNNVAKRNNDIESNAKEIVTIYNYRIWISYPEKRDLWDSTVTYVDTKFFFNRQYHVYALNDSLEVGNSYAIEIDSLFLNNVYYPNLDTIYISYKDEMIELIKSQWVKHECVFWNHDYGLVAAYDGYVLILYDKETMKGFAKEIFYNDFINRAKERQKVIFEELESHEYR